MANASDGVLQQSAEVNLQNFKAILDRFAALQGQGAEDNQGDARAYQALKLRMAHNAADFDKAINAVTITSLATGQTENQQTVSPAGTAASETAKGAVADAGSSVAAAAAGIATANQSIADAVANLMNALSSVIVTAAGGASTPSQTQAKPAAS